MGFAFGPVAFRPAPSASGGDGAGPPGVHLSADLAFLRPFGIPDELLSAAARAGLRLGVPGSEALLAEGGVSDTLYYFSLARHLRLPFGLGCPVLAGDVDPVIALRTGRARLAAGGWLVAPRDRTLDLLLAARRLGLALPALQVVAPARFAALLRQGAARSFAEAASLSLHERAPHLSARNVSLFPAPLRVGAALLSAFWLVAGFRALADGLGLLFLASMVLRVLAAACAPGRRPTPPMIDDAAAPFYSVLVALHDEAAIVPALRRHLEALDYPRAKLEVLFLVEEGDQATVDALRAEALPAHMRVIAVPDGLPRTKPRALNAGLMHARGSLLTVFDAEDRPAADQLRRAAGRFATAPTALACLQARLAVAPRGLLSRLFAIEYAALFDVHNVGAARLGLPIALGGTSNHFRTAVLREVGGWDAFNVTEDADLGMRLARFGYKVDDLASTTVEAADHDLPTWINQRRRWTKGWMQTALVLARDGGAARDLGFGRASAVALLLTHLVLSPLLMPVALLLVGVHLVRFGMAVPDGLPALCEAALAASVFLLGAVVPLGCAAAGMRARRMRAPWLLLLVLPYQLLISVAAWGGLVDLIRRPHHWRKTPHRASPKALSA